MLVAPLGHALGALRCQLLQRLTAGAQMHRVQQRQSARCVHRAILHVHLMSGGQSVSHSHASHEAHSRCEHKVASGIPANDPNAVSQHNPYQACIITRLRESPIEESLCCRGLLQACKFKVLFTWCGHALASCRRKGAYLVLGEPSRRRGRQEGARLGQALGAAQPPWEKTVSQQGTQVSHPDSPRSVARTAGRPEWQAMAQECCLLLLQRWELHLPP